MLKIDVITLFPNLFIKYLDTYPISKAIKKNELEVNLHDLKNFAIDKRGTVDGKTYGGGVGMVLRPEPIFDAVESIPKQKNTKILLLSPKGKTYNQKGAESFSKDKHLILICGRYEGVDARVKKYLVNETISIGNYVLSGGEIPAMVIIESITRLLPNVLKKDAATEIESFSNGTIEYPQYTRPENYKKMKVPKVLLSGNHAKIKRWRKENSKKISN